MAGNPLRTRQKQTMRFMLVPLIDVIFLLLTFFILSSSIDPYSSLALGEYRSEQGGDGQARETPAPENAPDLVVAISHGQAQANGRMVALEGFGDAVAALRQEGAETVIVFTRASATVQDVVTVLDALKKAAFRSVTIRTQPGVRS